MLGLVEVGKRSAADILAAFRSRVDRQIVRAQIAQGALFAACLYQSIIYLNF